MNLFLVGTIIFVFVYLVLNWFVKTSSKAIAKGTKKFILIFFHNIGYFASIWR